MSDSSKIEWCDSTFNPWTGCTKISSACDHCYAEALSRRAPKSIAPWGAGQTRRRTSPANWRKPVKWDAQGPVCVDCAQPVRGRDCACGQVGAIGAVRRRRVFCASLADVFDNEVPAQWRVDLFRLIAATPSLDWLLLTKRIGNAAAMMREVAQWCGGGEQPLPNVWLGATICNQAEADRDIPKLLATPAAVHFLSIEPMLGPIDLESLPGASGIDRGLDALSNAGVDPGALVPHRVEWVIAGGESGPHARPSHPDWFRSLRDQCAAARVPFLFKQWGEWAPLSRVDGVHELPFGDYMPAANPPFGFLRHGKKSAGRLLDGVEHNGFPEAP